MPNNKGMWFVAGTGTDAGKTIVTAGLLSALRESGVDCGIASPGRTDAACHVWRLDASTGR